MLDSDKCPCSVLNPEACSICDYDLREKRCSQCRLPLKTHGDKCVEALAFQGVTLQHIIGRDMDSIQTNKEAVVMGIVALMCYTDIFLNNSLSAEQVISLAQAKYKQLHKKGKENEEISPI